ncbi:MAG TPA: hypothetical protein DCK83_07080 [Gallionellaceae bacterium]|nr:hypothetical protein [Gallionellaceae bacterium]
MLTDLTHQKILAMLAGCDSQKPMPFDTLVEKTGLLPETLSLVLDQMQHSLPATINSCAITKGGSKQTVYWPTGAVGNPLSFHQINNRNWQRALDEKASVRREEVRPAASTEQEQTMTKSTGVGKGAQPSALNQTLYNLILASPGISEDELVKRVLKDDPEETEKHIRKTLANMRLIGKKVRGEGKRGNRQYHLDSRWNTLVVTPAAQQTGDTVVTGKETALRCAAEATAHHVESETKVAHLASVAGDEVFSIDIDDQNNLFISVGDQDLRLAPPQTARLHAFMRRVQLEVPA